MIVISDTSRQHRVYLIRETAVSMLVNGVLSALFVFLVFGGKERIGLWDTPGLALDFLPQTFIIAFMATLVPSVLTRKAVANGKIARAEGSASKLPSNLFVRSLTVATVVSLVVIPSAVAAIALGSSGVLPFSIVLPMKVAYGACLACPVTVHAIRTVLRDRVSG